MAESFHWFVVYVVPYLNFFIFLAILVYFARKPLSQAALKRKNSFESHYQSASEALRNAQHQLESLQRRSKALDAEIALMRAKAVSEAESEANKIIEEGKKQAELILQDAKRMRDAEYLQAQSELEREALELAKARLVKKLETDFDASKDRSFIEARVKEMSLLKISPAGGN